MTEQAESTTKNYKDLIRILGKNYVKEPVESPYDFIRIAKRGLNSRVIINFYHHFNLSIGETAHMLNTSESTIYRWTSANKQLSKNHSVKLFEIVDMFLYGIEVFESQENFFKWLNLPNTALGGMEPQELIEIPGGIAKIKNILGRIEYGVYS